MIVVFCGRLEGEGAKDMESDHHLDQGGVFNRFHVAANAADANLMRELISASTDANLRDKLVGILCE